MPNEQVTEKLKTLPTKPGVYQYFDARGKIIYVGKAINLINHVRDRAHHMGCPSIDAHAEARYHPNKQEVCHALS